MLFSQYFQSRVSAILDKHGGLKNTRGGRCLLLPVDSETRLEQRERSALFPLREFHEPATIKKQF